MNDSLDRVHCCDCLRLTKSLPDNCIDLLLTSPPYNSGRGKVGGFATGTYDIYNDQQDEKTYQHELMVRMKAFYRVLKPTGSMFIVIGQRAIKCRLVYPYWISQIPGMKLNGVLIRRFKNSPQVRPVRFYPRHEPIFWLYKEWPPYFDKTAARLGDVWDISPEPDRRHPSKMPSEMVRRIILACSRPGDTVFDPFNGLGTTCIEAKKLKRHYLGCDISPKYCRIARELLKKIKTEK